MRDLAWHGERSPSTDELVKISSANAPSKRKRTSKGTKKKAQEKKHGLASIMRKSFKGKKDTIQKDEALRIVKKAFKEAFPDLGNFAKVSLRVPGKGGKGERTLTFTMKKVITKADVLVLDEEC